MNKGYKTKSAKAGAKALKRYRKSKKRRAWVEEHFWATLIMDSAVIGLSANLSQSILITSIVMIVYVLLSLLWLSGRIF